MNSQAKEKIKRKNPGLRKCNIEIVVFVYFTKRSKTFLIEIDLIK